MRLGLEAGPHTLDLAGELGIGGVVIDGGALVDNGLDATVAPLHERGLAVCQVGAFAFDPLTADAAARERLAAILALAPATGCPQVVIGPGNHHPAGFAHYDPRNFTEAALDELAAALTEPVAVAESHGALVCIEPYLKGVINSAARFRGLCERLPSSALRCNVDVSSLYDFREAIDPTRLIEETCTGIAERCGLVHVKEVAVAEGFHLHMGLAPLAAGRTDWARVLQLMAPQLPDTAWVVLEHVCSPEQGREDHRLLLAAAAAAGVRLD